MDLPFLSTFAGEGLVGLVAELQVSPCPASLIVAVGFHGNVALFRLPVTVGRKWERVATTLIDQEPKFVFLVFYCFLFFPK